MTREQIETILNRAINPDQLRQAFKALCFDCHPDTGGDTRSMQILLDVFQTLLKQMSGKNFHRKNTTGTQTEYTYAYNAVHETEFTDQLQATISAMPSTVVIEIRGSWIWLHGDTKPVKDRIKGLGYMWKASDCEWYWRTSDQKKKFRGYRVKSKDEIRSAYGYSQHTGSQKQVH